MGRRTRGIHAEAGAPSGAKGARVAVESGVASTELALPGFAVAVRTHHWALFALLVIAVSQLHQTFGIIGKLRPALMLMALVACYALARPRDFAIRGAFRLWPARLVAALAVVACGSVPFGLSMGSSGKFLIDTYSKTLLVAFLVYTSISSTRHIRLFVWAYVAATGILGFTSSFMGAMAPVGGTGLARLVGTGAYDANDTGLVVLLGLPLALACLTESRGILRLFSLGTLGLIGITVAKTGSRGALLGLAAVGLALLLTVSIVPIYKRLALGVVVAGALALTAPPGYWDQMRTMLNPEEDYNMTSETGRRAILLRGLGYAAQYPIFGVGINNFPIAEGTISDIARNLPPGVGFKWSVAHNSFLQAAAEMGVVGGLLFVALVLGGVMSGRQLRRWLPHRRFSRTRDQQFLWTLSYYLPLSFVAFLVSGFFVSFAYLDHIYFFATLVAASLRLAKAGSARGTALPAAATPGHVRPPAVLMR